MFLRYLIFFWYITLFCKQLPFKLHSLFSTITSGFNLFGCFVDSFPVFFYYYLCHVIVATLADFFSVLLNNLWRVFDSKNCLYKIWMNVCSYGVFFYVSVLGWVELYEVYFPFGFLSSVVSMSVLPGTHYLL